MGYKGVYCMVQSPDGRVHYTIVGVSTKQRQRGISTGAITRYGSMLQFGRLHSAAVDFNCLRVQWPGPRLHVSRLGIAPPTYPVHIQPVRHVRYGSGASV
jgi:hypothetical protein